jgi:predicted alpha/beta hydrolase family esterase
MKNAILYHGLQDKNEYLSSEYPAPGNGHWFPWLQKQLLMRDIYAETPIAADSYRPVYETWKDAFERCDHIGNDTILVGHSCGGGFIVRWLSENKDVHVGKVVLVAPWLNPGNKDGYNMGDFFEFELDPNFVSRTAGVTVFVSNDDFPTILESVDILTNGVEGVEVKRFDGMKHFCLEDMGTEKFPELLEEVLL